MSLDFKRLGEQLGIENLEELVNQSELKRKERQNEIEQKYPIKKEDVLMFSNIFHDNRFDMEIKGMLPSEMLMIKENVIIPFGNRNEIVNEESKKKFILLMKLLQSADILIYLEDYKINNYSKKNKLIGKILEDYRIKENDPINKVAVAPKGYGESLFDKKNIFQRIWDSLRGKNKVYEYKRDGAKFFINDLLDEKMEDFIDNLDYGIDFNMRVFDKNMFVRGILTKIENYSSKISKPLQIENVYKNIKEQIGNKENYAGNVLLSYPLSDYIDNKSFYYTVIFDLYVKEYLTIKEIYIIEGSVNFVIEKINRFKYDIINELFPIYGRISFDGGNLKLDSNILLSGKKKKQKIYELIDIIVRGIKKYRKLEINYEELKDIFIKNEDNFPYFYKTINKDGKYKSNKSILEKENNKKMIVEYEKNINYLLNKVFCLSFFNSSLSKEKIDFILKEKSTGLIINQD